MMTLRTFDARMLTAQRQGKTSFYMQHMGEEAVQLRLPPGARARRHELPDLPAGGPADRRRLPDGRDDEPDLLQRGRSAEGPAAAGACTRPRSTASSSISGNLATQFIQAVGWAMASAIRGDTRIAAGWIGDGSTAESDFHAALVFASTYRAPVVLNIVNNQWAISTFQGIARGGVGHLRRPRPRLRHPVAAGRRQRLSRRPRRREVGGRARPPQPRADARRIRHLPRRRAFDLRRSLRLPAEDRVRRLAARRPGDPAEEPPDRDRRLVGGPAQAGRGRDPRRGDRGAEGGREARHAALPAASRRRATCSRASTPTMPPHLRRQRQKAGV